MSYEGIYEIHSLSPYGGNIYNEIYKEIGQIPPPGIDFLVTDNNSPIVTDSGQFIEVV